MTALDRQSGDGGPVVSAASGRAPNRREDLEGGVAVVTGATGGIGRAVAEGLAASGVDVLAVGRHQDSLDELGHELVGAHGVSFKAQLGDLSDPGSAQRVGDEAWKWQGRVDLVVNAAGVIVRSSVEDTTAAEWDATFAVNTRGAFLLTQRLGARMLAGGGGSVVNVTSLAGEVVTGAPIAYGASKAALIYLTRYLAVRWAPKIRVNSVAPGYVRTNLNEKWLEDERNLRFVLDRTPMNGVASPGDLVGAALFLASPAAAYVTAQNLVVDGGWSAQ